MRSCLAFHVGSSPKQSFFGLIFVALHFALPLLTVYRNRYIGTVQKIMWISAKSLLIYIQFSLTSQTCRHSHGALVISFEWNKLKMHYIFFAQIDASMIM